MPQISRTPRLGAWISPEFGPFAKSTIATRAKSSAEHDWLAAAEPKQDLEHLLLCAAIATGKSAI